MKNLKEYIKNIEKFLIEEAPPTNPQGDINTAQPTAPQQNAPVGQTNDPAAGEAGDPNDKISQIDALKNDFSNFLNTLNEKGIKLEDVQKAAKENGGGETTQPTAPQQNAAPAASTPAN